MATVAQTAPSNEINRLTYGGFSESANSGIKKSVKILAAVLVCSLLYLFYGSTHIIVPFFLMTMPTLWGLHLWGKKRFAGAPLLPIFLLQQTIIYTLPLLSVDPESEPEDLDAILLSSVLIALFLLTTIGVWSLCKFRKPSKPSKLSLTAGEGQRSIQTYQKVSYFFLIIALSFEVAARAGILGVIFFGPFASFFSLAKTFSSASSILGAVLGSLTLGSSKRGKVPFFTLLALISIFQVADVLLSASAAVILATTLGLGLGRQKLPIGFILVSFLALAFLNQGKFVMRSRYWSEHGNVSNISLTDMPGFYSEWFDASISMFESSFSSESTSDKSQSLTERVNSLQNMSFVLKAMTEEERDVLNGETYLLVPQLLVPRILWKNKPIAHAGQVRLNLHFGRQKSLEETKVTFIAWGLLPEAIGNFGLWLGPLFLGVVCGFVFARLEHMSVNKKLLSVEGLLVAASILILGRSFEMVAGVFISSLFQFLVSVGCVGYALHIVLKGSSQHRHLPRPAR